MSAALRLSLLVLCILALAPQGADAYLIWMECDGLNVPDYVYGKDKAQAYDNYDTYVGSAANQCRMVLECPDPGWYGSAGVFMEGYSCGGTTRQAAADKAISECQKVGGQDCTGGHGWTDCDDGSSYVVQPHATMMPPRQKMFFSEGSSGGVCGAASTSASSTAPKATGDEALIEAAGAKYTHPQYKGTTEFTLDGCTGTIKTGKNGQLQFINDFSLSEVTQISIFQGNVSFSFNSFKESRTIEGEPVPYKTDQAPFFLTPGTNLQALYDAFVRYFKQCGANPKVEVFP